MSHSQALPAHSAGNRLSWLDVAKGIGILFVIYAHINYRRDLLLLIYSFHMPLFFILSGFAFDRSRYPDFMAFLRRKWQTLIVPYVIFSILPMVYAYLCEQFFPYAVDVSQESYIQGFVQVFLAQGSDPVFNSPMWFVPSLLIVEILYYFLSKLTIALRIPICIVVTALGWLLQSGILPLDNALLPWTLDSALFALGFYALGHLVAPCWKQAAQYLQRHKHKWLLCLGILVLTLAIWLPMALANGKVSFGSRHLNNGLLLYGTGITGTLAVLIVSLLLEKSKSLQYLGRNSFCIMAVHLMIRHYTLTKYYRLFGLEMYNNKSIRQTIVPFLIVLALSILTTVLYNFLSAQLRKRKHRT